MGVTKIAKKKKDINPEQKELVSEVDDSTVLITSTSEERDNCWEARINNDVAAYDPSNKMYSAYLNFSGTANDITQDQLDTYAKSAQTSLDSVTAINDIIRKEINGDDIIGMVMDSIENNINLNYRLSYKNFGTQRNKAKKLENAKSLINDFNYQIDIEQFIFDAIDITYCEGNYICLLRNSNDNWHIDYLPLGIAEISGYTENGNPVVLMNMQKLKTALQKTMLKSKSGKALFFNSVEEEIKANYPAEVYEAYKNNDTYAKLDPAYTGVIRINNHGRKYGVSPIFRALSPMITLRSFQAADTSGAKAKSKKIIHQVLRGDILGKDGKNKGFDLMAFSHKEFMKAFANDTVVYTSPAAVEKIEYIEPKTQDISTDKINEYRSRVLTSLGIAFLASSGDLTAASANISLAQLLQSINKTSKQVERVLEHFYDTLLTTNGIELSYRPSVQILDSEMLTETAKMELAKLLYTTFSCSRETAFSTIGIDIEDEISKREKENTDGLSDIFTPYVTSFTTTTDTTNTNNGRPADTNSNDPAKQAYDQENNKAKE